MPSVKIYTLRCPFTNKIYYVGATVSALRIRVVNHYCQPTTKLIHKEGLHPIIELVERIDPKEAYDAELFWINQFIAWGFPLENSRTAPAYQLAPFAKYHRVCKFDHEDAAGGHSLAKAGIPLSQDELKALRKYLRACGSLEVCAKRIGITKFRLQCYLQGARVRKTPTEQIKRRIFPKQSKAA